MAPSVEKKIAELEMGLLHLQQNIEIPEISLPIHPIITNVAKQCYERGEKPKVTDFGDKVEDPTFLNQLQSGVNRWIREIQKVRAQTERVRTLPSSGTGPVGAVTLRRPLAVPALGPGTARRGSRPGSAGLRASPEHTRPPSLPPVSSS